MVFACRVGRMSWLLCYWHCLGYRPLSQVGWLGL